ncbi:DUF1819 family protein [bacterium]|nr:DUF1819 family protein [bacterium]
MVLKNKYSFSFTGASALSAETLIIAEEYVRLQDWEKVKVSVQENNLMNKTKQNTSKRMYHELKKRLELLTNEQLNLLVNGSPDESKAMVLLSLLKAYSFFKDFVIEVIRTKYLLYNNIIVSSDYTSFFNTKAITHNELNTITEKTTNKVKQVLFKMLEQVGLINSAKDGIIIKPFLSDDSIKAIINDDASLLAGFLCSDAEIKTLKKSTVHG